MYVCSNGIKTAVILQDTDALHPRRDQDNLATMVCWHRKYGLGDRHDFDDAQEFAERLAKDHLGIKDVFQGIHEGLVDGYRLVEVAEDFPNKAYASSYFLQRYGGLPGHKEWRNADWYVTKDFDFISSRGQSLEDLIESFNIRSLLKVLDHSDKVAIKPLYLYDHSMQSISTGSFVGRAHQAEWDSGCVGFAYLDKETAMREMAMPAETLRIASVIPFEERKEVSFPVQKAFDPLETGDFLKLKGFERVEKSEFVRNLSDACLPGKNRPVLDEAYFKGGFVFKKDHRLYTLQCADRDKGVRLSEIAVFNPDLKPLTEEAWKERAFEAIEGEVKEYDNYLQGEVYGYQCYEGLEEVDSCWGFNPGSERIQDLMEDELRGWFGSKMDFEYEAGEDFDIEEYFEENDFPELRGEIRKLVETQLHHTAQKAERKNEAFPYAVSYEDICWNKDDVLSNVVESLYEEHCIPSEARIHEAFQEFAGISREAQPKLRAADLDPEKDYTVEEIMELMKAKASLDQIISAASSVVRENSTRTTGPDRDDR